MERCRWCANKIKSKLGNFCSLECAVAAEELPELVEREPVRVLAHPRKTRRLRFFSLGVLVGAVGAWLFLPRAEVSEEEPIQAPIQCALRDLSRQAPPPEFFSKGIIITVTDIQGGWMDPKKIEHTIERKFESLLSFYEEALRAEPNLRGTLQLRFKVGPGGYVEWVSRLDRGLSHHLDPEVIKLLGNLRFPTEAPVPSFYMGPSEVTVQIHFGELP